MILWWRTTTTAPPRIILVPIASDGLSVRRRVVYELVYQSEPTDGASVEMELHYSYAHGGPLLDDLSYFRWVVDGFCYSGDEYI